MDAPEPLKDDLLDKLYLASTNESSWPEFLAAMANLFRASIVALMASDIHPSEQPNVVKQPTRIELQYGVPEDLPKLYAAYYGARDPWFLASQKRQLTEWVGPGSELCPVGDFERTEFYNDFFKANRYPAFFQLGAHIIPDPGVQAVFSILRDRRHGDYTEGEIGSLNSFVPHLQRVLQIQRKMAGVRQMAESTGSVLASLDIALIALDRNCRVCLANGLAESILSSGYILRQRDGRLAAPLPREHAALRKVTEAAASRDWNHQPETGNLTLHSGERALHLTVMPVGSPMLGVPNQAAVLITITPETVPKPRDRSLASLFQLTPAEIRVSMLLLEGLEPKEIAERINVTYETVRFQLKMIYRKVGVSRQSQLVRLLSRLPGC